MDFTKKIVCLICLSLFLIGFNNCSKNELPNTSVENILNLPEVNYDYSKNLGSHFGSPTDQSDFDSSFNKKIELGRVLFYDKNLSVNNTTACASCHIQELAFSDDVAFSQGFREAKTERNSLPLFNEIFDQRLFWDASASNLEQQVLLPVANHIEMGIEDLDYLEKKLALIDYYKELFGAAYSSSLNYIGNAITSRNISDALAKFVGSIFSNESKYDAGYLNNFSQYTSREKLGLSLYFKSGCNGCHNLEVNSQKLIEIFGEDKLFNSNDFSANLGIKGEISANIGLDLEHTDEGVQNGKFKTPSVRNVELTAPYMHDGRFETLEEVIEHYNEGIEPHQNLDCRLTGQCNKYDDAISSPNKNDPIQFDFNRDQQKALVAFLKTLTDKELIKSPLYANPFK